MADFLDTTATSYHIEKLLKSARERIILISPYLKLRPRIRQLIEDASRLNVTIHVVYGKSERCNEVDLLRAVPGVQVTFCKNVHAKCYLNEEFGVVTSLNLYDFSQANNQEMGVLFTRISDIQLYAAAYEEAERIIRISGGQDFGQSKPSSVKPARIQEVPREYEKLTTSKLADRLGLLVSALYDKLIGRGYLELRDGGKRYLTARGKTAGGEFRMGKGPFFLWPTNLDV